MFLDSTDLSQVTLDSKCLAFLVLCGEPGEEWGIEDHSSQVGQTYSPETGIASWPNRTGADAIPPLSLRSNTQLAKWEPITPEKFKLMALDCGVIGEDIQVPGRVVRPTLTAVAVTPPGFVFRWEHASRLWVSDVRRLAELKNPLADRWNGAWSRYTERADPGTIDPHTGSALIGDGAMPTPFHREHFMVNSLAECANTAGTLVHELGYNPAIADYTPETVAFIQTQFGVNVSGIKDWHDANRHRMINSLFGHTASFDHTAACTALRLAVDRSRRQQRIPNQLAKALPKVAKRQPPQRPAQ